MKITIQDLVVVSLRVDQVGDEQKRAIKEWGQESNAFDVSNCARRIWIGCEKDFRKFPETLDKAQTYEGADAYAQILTYACGITGNKIDTHNRHKYQTYIGKLKDKSPRIFSQYKSIFEQIDGDVSWMDRKALKHYQSSNRIQVTRDLSGFERNETVAIMAFINSRGNLSRQTIDLINTLGAHRKRHAKKMVIMHPDAPTLKRIQKFMVELEKKHKMRAKVSFALGDDEHLSGAMEQHNRIYICNPRDVEPDLYQHVIDLWQARENQRNTLTYIRDVSENDSGVRTDFHDAARADYISTREVDKELKDRYDQNVALIGKSTPMIAQKAQSRLQREKELEPQAAIGQNSLVPA